MPGIDAFALLGAAHWTTTDAERLQRAQQRARFDLMIVASRRALAGDVATGNAEVRTVLDANPQMRGWVVINPSYPERSAEDMRRTLAGPKWVGAVLDVTSSTESLVSSSTRELITAFRRYTKPLYVRVPSSRQVLDLEALATEFNTVKIIAGGAGGDDWHACMLAAKRQTNLFLEPFSGGVHRGKLEGILTTLGAHRVLFASNYPDQNPGHALGLLVESKLSDADKQTILTTSAARLFGLQRPA